MPSVGCRSVHRSPAAAAAELRVPLVRDIQSLDPLEGDEVTTASVIRQLYEGLVEYDPRTLAVAPRLARAWTISADGRTWAFDLEPGVRFVDDPCFPNGRGRLATAADFKRSIERGLEPSHSPAAGAADAPILGLDAFRSGAAPHVAGIVARTSRELEIHLAHPYPRLLHLLARPRCWLVAPEAVQAYPAELRKHPVGTGPFRLVSWEPLSGILLVRNRAYWRRDSSGTRLPYLDALRFVPYWQGDAGRMFAEGELDMMFSYVLGRGGHDPALRPAAAAHDGRTPQTFFVTHLNTIYVRLDYRSSHPAVHDRRLREVLSLALPRPVGTTTHVPAHGLLPPGLPGYDPDLPGQRTDLAAAARRLAQAGHPGGRGLPALRIAWREWDAGVGNQFAASLRSLGIHIDITLYNDAEYWPAVRAGHADLFRDGWVADDPDPENFLQLFSSRSSASGGLVGYPNPAYDRLFERLEVEADAARRLALAGRLERILVDDAAALFLHHERETQLVSPRVEDWEINCTNPLDLRRYEWVRVRPREPGQSNP